MHFLHSRLYIVLSTIQNTTFFAVSTLGVDIGTYPAGNFVKFARSEGSVVLANILRPSERPWYT